jgi:Bacterial Alpha-2-macroglobulin MG10 domain/Alpha-2-macroglobulin family
MKKGILIAVCFIISLHAIAQKLAQSISLDSTIYVFQLDKNQVQSILKHGAIKDTNWYFQTPFAQVKMDSFQLKQLPFGNFLIAKIVQHTINYQLHCNVPFTITSAYINNDALIYLTNATTKDLVKDAVLSINQQRIFYDSGYGAYAIPIKDVYTKGFKRDSVCINIEYQGRDYVQYARLQKQKPIAKGRGEINYMSAGYLVISKPMYQKGDTLKLKAYLVNNQNGKPINKKIKLTISEPSQNFSFTKKLKSITNGAYVFDWQLPDSLSIDKQYVITLDYENNGVGIQKQETFYLENYSLAKSNISASIVKPTFYGAEQIAFRVSATDANRFPLNGVQVQYALKLANLTSMLCDTLRIPQEFTRELFKKDTILPFDRINQFTIPSSILPNADAQYILDITVTDPIRFETKSFSFTVNKINKIQQTLFYQTADSVILRTLNNGTDTAQEFKVYVLDNTDTLERLQIKTPFFYKLPSPNITSVVYVDQQKKVSSSLPVSFNALMIAKTNYVRTADSIHFTFAYPFASKIHYKIFKGDQLVQSAEANNLNYHSKDDSKTKYTILFTQQLHHSIADRFTKIIVEPPMQQLNIITDLPETAFPGQKLFVNLAVSDYKGLPLAGINIASYAQNAQFAQRLIQPTITVPMQYQNKATVQNVPFIAALTLYANSINQSNALMQKHVQQFNLHRNEWYQLHYPTKQVSTIVVPSKNAASEYCVVIVKNKNMYTPKYVKANTEYVYMHDVTKTNQYSIPAASNKLIQISARYANYLVNLQALSFAPNTKTIIILNADSLQSLKPLSGVVQSIDTMNAFTPSIKEKEEMLAQLILTSGLNWNDTICMQLNNGDTTSDSKRILGNQLMQIGADRFYLFGPVPLSSHPSITINHRKHNVAKGLQVNYYNAELQSFTMRNYAKSITEQLFSFIESPVYLPQVLYSNVQDTVVPAKQVTQGQWNSKAFEKVKPIAEKQFVQQYYPNDDNANAQIIIQNTNDSIYAKAIWVIHAQQMRKSNFVSNCPRNQFVFTKFNSSIAGNEIIILLNNNRMIRFKNLKIAEGTSFYIQPSMMQSKLIAESDLDSALLLYNKITAIPMTPFWHAPMEVNANAIITKNRRTLYIHGNVHNDHLQPIANALIIAEINGKYHAGAITNQKGEYEFLNLEPATYSFKVYAAAFRLLHILPKSYETATDYLLNISLNNSSYQEPVWQSFNHDFRLMAFIKDETENKIAIHAYDADTREELKEITVELLQNDSLKNKQQLSNTCEVNFLNNNREAKFILRKDGYQTIILNAIRYHDGYYYAADFFMQKQLQDQVPMQINVQMNNFAKLTTQSVLADGDVKLSYIPKSILKENQALVGKITYEGIALKDVFVEAIKDGILQGIDRTNENGEFAIRPLSTGVYQIKIHKEGLKNITMDDVIINETDQAELQVIMPKKVYNSFDGVMLKAKAVKRKALVIDQEMLYRGFDADTIEASHINAAPLQSGTYANNYISTNAVSGVSLGGGRAENTIYIIDGMITRNVPANIPSGAISEVSIGGLAANLGDDNGGVVNNQLENKLQELMTDTSFNSIRKNFSDVGYWQPNIITNKKGQAAFTIQLPDNITTWQANTLAMGDRFLHGIQQQQLSVYKPMQTMCVSPAFMHKGDHINAKANFVNLTSAPKWISSYISINQQVQQQDSFLLENSKVQQQAIDAKTLDTIVWQAGLRYQSNYKDGEQYSIPVFATAMQTFANQSMVMEADSTYQLNIAPNTKGKIIFNNNMYERIMVLINELEGYQYGCIEQTTSKLKAVLFKQQILKALGKQPDVQYQVDLLMNKLNEMRNKQHTWGWWSRQDADWHITLYVCEVLYTANALGFNNSIYFDALEQAKKNLASMDDDEACYALYILQKTNLFNKQCKNALAAMHENELSPTAKIYYYKVRLLQGETISDADMYSVQLQLNEPIEPHYDRHFFAEPSANIYRAYLLFKGTKWETDLLARFKNGLAQQGAENQLNTFTKALLIEALAQAAQGNDANMLNSTITINDTLVINKFPCTMPIKHASYRIKHSGSNVFANTSEAIEIENPKVMDSLFVINTWFQKNGKKIDGVITAGSLVQLLVDVQCYRTSTFVMVEIPIPSGMQVTEAQKMELRNSGNHIEFYKHKINVYYATMPIGKQQLRLEMMPNFTGTMMMPAAKASLMYYPYVYGCNQNKVMVIE